ncbi:MAG: SH3 domain-containing protein [Clostridia bacterium]
MNHTRKCRALAWISLVCLLCTYAVAAMPAALAGDAPVAVIDNANPPYQVYLRAGPGTSTEPYGCYYSGVLVTVHDRTNSEWWKVEIGSRSGYMQARFLIPCGWQSEWDETARARAYCAIPWGVVVNPNPADRLNLRKRPDESWASSGKYYNGTRVQILGSTRDWYHVLVDDDSGYPIEGYMKAQYIRMEGSDRPSGDSSGQAVGYAVVSNPNPADRLHLRKTPNRGGASLGKYYTGVSVEVLPYDSWEWALVRIGDVVGYMQKKYLAFPPADSRVRSAIPHMTLSAPIDLCGNSYATGTRVEVWGIADERYHVCVDGRIGYIPARKLTPAR